MAELNLEDLTVEKDRLTNDRKVLLERLQAIGGAIQTCDYFISKLQPPQESEESAVEETVEEDDS